MILDEYLEVGINYKNIEHFKLLGYDVKCSQRIKVPIKHLSEQCNLLVNVKCDICGSEKKIKYQSYIKNTKFRETVYACSTKCAWQIKNRSTCLKKYGVDAPMKSKGIQNKSKKTCIEKYGVENISQSNYFKNKYKETMLDRYGVENGFQYDGFKKKSINTMLKKYGVKFNNQRIKIRESMKGENNNFYIHGNHVVGEWRTPEAKATRVDVFIRDNRTCDICKVYNKNLEVHHLYSRNTHKELMYEVDNCITLCKECHKDFHLEFGYGNNTPMQYKKFKDAKLK